MIDREPTTLRALEDSFGFAIPRDANKPWKARCKQPVPGIDHVFAALVGPSVDALRVDPDPQLDELGFGTEVDCVELATQLLGPAGAIDRRASDRRYHRWQRGDGELAIRDGYVSWVRQPPRAVSRSSDDEAQLVANIAALLDRDITFDAIEQIFGSTRIEGRTDTRSVRGPTWFLGVPIIQTQPYNVTLAFDPSLPCEPLFAALGWHDIVIDHDQQRIVTALAGEHRWYPVADCGFLVNVSIHEPAGIVLGAPYAAVARQRPLATHHVYLTRSLHHQRATP